LLSWGIRLDDPGLIPPCLFGLLFFAAGIEYRAQFETLCKCVLL
jgi:hypothetical protein